MQFYIIFFLIFVILSFLEIFTKKTHKIKSKLVFGISAIFVFLSTFYYGSMGDYFSYSQYFSDSVSYKNLYTIDLNRFEYLYEFVQVLAYYIIDDYRFLRLILAVIVMKIFYSIYIKGDNGEINQYPFTMILILWSLKFGNIFIIRSTIASAICIYSVRYIKKSKFNEFFLCTVIAALFHRMCLLWVCAYFLYSARWIRKYIYMGIAFGYIFSQYLPRFLSDFSIIFGSKIHQRVSGYMIKGTQLTYGLKYDTTFMLFKASINGFFLLIVFGILLQLKRNDKDKIIMNGEYTIYLFGFMLQVWTLMCSSAVARVAAPFIGMQYYLLPRIFNVKYDGLFSKMFVFIVFVVYLFLRMLVSANSAEYIPFVIKF